MKLEKHAARIIELKGLIEILQSEADDLRKVIVESLGTGEWYDGSWKVTIADRERKSLDTKMLELKFGEQLDPFRRVTQFKQCDIKNVGKSAATIL
jgi:hypothetical protein